MSIDQVILLGLLGAVFAFFVWGRWRYDLVAFGALLVFKSGLAISEVRDATRRDDPSL